MQKGAVHEQDQRSQWRHRRRRRCLLADRARNAVAYGVKYLRFNRKTNILTPIGWSGERMGPDADLGPLVRDWEAEQRGKREWYR
jgi:hypothetical protein